MSKSIRIGSGIDSIPTNTIPDDPTQFVSWFKSVGLKRWFANGDTRNAVAGTGVSITGQISTPATVSASASVTSVGLTDGSTPPIFNITGGGAGAVALTETLKTQAPNSFLAGPPSGAAAAEPAFRALVAADIPVVSAAVPATIPDLIHWFASDNINVTASSGTISRLLDRTPWATGVFASFATGNATIAATPLNGLPLLAWGGASGYPMVAGFEFPTAATIFAVIRPATTTGGQAILGCTVSSGISFYLEAASGTGRIAIVKSGVSTIGTATNAWAAGTAFQCNVTYVASTGAFAFRQARTANGSGTGTVGAGPGVATNLFASDSNTGTAPLGANTGIAETIAYSRLLTSTEITNVENYLFAKWGV